MKQKIHPEIHEVTAHCACGNSFQTISTAPDIRATICSKCHPFFTGAQKYIDVAGRIEKFEARYKKFQPGAEAPKAAKKEAAKPAKKK